MATTKEEEFTEMLDHLNDYNERHGEQFSSQNLRDSVIRVME